MKIDGEEISEYIKSVLEGIQSLPDEKAISSPIKFRLSLSSTIEGEAGVKLFVASAGGTSVFLIKQEIQRTSYAKILFYFESLVKILGWIIGFFATTLYLCKV